MGNKVKTCKAAVGLIVLCFLLVFSSEKFPADQAEIATQSGSLPNYSKTAIKLYADSINSILPKALSQKSLRYTINDYTLQVFKYSIMGDPVLYVEKISKGDNQAIEKRYYVKDNKLALLSEVSSHKNTSQPYISTNAYFRNNLPFYTEQKSALNDSGLSAISFKKTDLVKEDQFSKMSVLEDALNQRGKFNLVFNGIAESPKARYIILGSNEFNSFRAPIRVQNEDEFIHELSTNASQYRGEKLNIDFQVNDTNEIVYQKGSFARN